MPRQSLNIEAVLKLSTKDILSLPISDLDTLSIADLRRVVACVGSTVNKRVTRLKNNNLRPNVLINLEETGGRIYAYDKDTKSKLFRELSRARAFLGTKESTVTGAKRVGAYTYDVNRFWYLYHKLEEKYKGKIGKGSGLFDSEKLQEMLRDELIKHPDKEDDDILELMSDKINEEYERYESETDDFFTI